MLPDIPGTDTRGFAALVDQVKGQNFMTAFQSLKGAGAITEAEGSKAERAQARLDRAQSEKDFDVALKDLKEVVVAGMERARQKAGIKNNQQVPAPNNDLKKKYGLD
jgi:outer membrane protein TolC